MQKSSINFAKSFAAVALLIFVSVNDGCKKKSDNSPSSSTTQTQGPNDVWIASLAFSPGTITVAVNTTITWTNMDNVAHTVTSDNSFFDSGTISIGGTYSRQFTSVGTFPYHCEIHPAMMATVIVQ